MEEHFRKSLGDDYKKVFQQPEAKKEESSAMELDPVKAFNDDLDMTGYTVDDHFAKALGDTWIKLQAEAAEKKEKKLPVGPSHKESKTQLLALWLVWSGESFSRLGSEDEYSLSMIDSRA